LASSIDIPFAGAFGDHEFTPIELCSLLGNLEAGGVAIRGWKVYDKLSDAASVDNTSTIKLLFDSGLVDPDQVRPCCCTRC
jgi:hypothetical protein